MTFDFKYTLTALSAGFLLLGSMPAQAQDYGSGTTYSTEITATTPAEFIKKRYNIKGTWNIVDENGQKIIRFNDDFKTKGGPDLKVFLSSKTVDELSGATVAPTSLKLSVLKSNKGSQSYIIPADVNLSDYKSVLIHCEAFSVLWGGFDL